MRAALGKAQLYLDGKAVGIVHVRGWEGAWGMGEFRPAEQFSQFAPLFGVWSLLMHAEDDQARISEAASDELRRIELAIDALHARLHFQATDEWHDVGNINIDGKFVEWKDR